MTNSNTEDVTGFVYCPPGWDEARLREGNDADQIKAIAMDTYTDIAYIKEKNAIQIAGESHEDVYKAQTQLNTLFFPVIVKSKRQWARPDRPGSWGQRRDSVNVGYGGQNHGGLRRMKSESALSYSNRNSNSSSNDWRSPHNDHHQNHHNNYRNSYQQHQATTSGGWNTTW